mmetsp:Transcript_40324/g.105931  ORF Transcript_40324/g.105931 Transcript_40324/m.105931 type:complete len:291 (+) Transcript_40324:2604-3476(+)
MWAPRERQPPWKPPSWEEAPNLSEKLRQTQQYHPRSMASDCATRSRTQSESGQARRQRTGPPPGPLPVGQSFDFPTQESAPVRIQHLAKFAWRTRHRGQECAYSRFPNKKPHPLLQPQNLRCGPRALSQPLRQAVPRQGTVVERLLSLQVDQQRSNPTRKRVLVTSALRHAGSLQRCALPGCRNPHRRELDEAPAQPFPGPSCHPRKIPSSRLCPLQSRTSTTRLPPPQKPAAAAASRGACAVAGQSIHRCLHPNPLQLRNCPRRIPKPAAAKPRWMTSRTSSASSSFQP